MTVFQRAATAALLLMASCVHPAHVEKTSRELAYIESTWSRTEIQRCGKAYPINTGFILHNVDEAFPAGSEAAAHGRAAEEHAETAMWLTLASTVLSITGLLVTVTADYDAASGLPGQAWAGISIAALAVVPTSIATGQAVSAQTRVYDAVNAYNDAVFANPEGACAEDDASSGSE